MIDWKEKYEKQRMITLALIGLIIGIIAASAASFILQKKEPQPQKKTGQVVEKFMTGDQHFLQLTIAVSPEEYIGYDIGDEYEVKK